MFHYQAANTFAAVMAIIDGIQFEVSWMFCITDADGYGDDPTYAVLTIVVEKQDLIRVREAIGGAWEEVEGNYYQISKRAPLEIEVVEKGIV